MDEAGVDGIEQLRGDRYLEVIWVAGRSYFVRFLLSEKELFMYLFYWFRYWCISHSKWRHIEVITGIR